MSQLEQIVLEDTITLRIDDKIRDKIKYICREIYDVEWSGVLLYEIYKSCNTKELDKLIFVIKDVLPINIGDNKSTSYNYTDHNDIMIDYFNNDSKRLKWKTGLIHSHHNLPVKFSKEDFDELGNNSANHNFYLSLVVNNWGDYNAFVGMKGESNNGSYRGINEKGMVYPINYKAPDKLFLYNCYIENYKVSGTIADYHLSNLLKTLKGE